MKMANLKTVILILFLINSECFAEYYSTPLLKTDWKIKKGSSYCQLKQNIPLYGAAEFIHQSGELLRFSISEKRFKPEIVTASLVIDTSPWSHQSQVLNEHLVYLDRNLDIQNHSRLSVYGETAEAMLDALSGGMFPTFIYKRASINGLLPENRVAVSAVNFSKKYNQFVDCRKDFLPSGLKQVLEKSLFFNPASKKLNTLVVNQLIDIARYVKEVKGSQIVIVSNTAIAGKRDKRWFSNRANSIVNKLNGLGVHKSKVSIKNGFYASSNNKVIQLSVFGPDALNSIYYRKGNIKLTETEKRRLNLIVRYSQEFLPDRRIVISSHTDSKGSKAKNLRVSQKRGYEIKRYLISKGLDEKKVQVKAYGETRPAKSNRFPKGRSQNRRAIISFIG